MNRPKLDDKDYKALVREIGKLETHFGPLETRGAMRRYLNNIKERVKRKQTISQLRHELEALEARG